MFTPDTFEWNYAGEAGVEVIARNSHSMGVILSPAQNYLVIYGGASPEFGPLSDTIYSKLPPSTEIGQ
jgi:hypothetical protein